MDKAYAKIGQWGNSDAVRIPAAMLRKAGLSRGQEACVTCRDDGVLEIFAVEGAHRCVRAVKGVSFETLCSGWTQISALENPWEGICDEGKEADAWKA